VRGQSYLLFYIFEYNTANISSDFLSLFESNRDLHASTTLYSSPLLESLKRTMSKHGWPSCLCKSECICKHGTGPEWTKDFGDGHPFLRCFDMGDEDFIFSDLFCSGIQRIRKYLPKKDIALDLITQIAFSNALDSLSSHTAQEREKHIAYRIGLKGMNLRFFASGCACGHIVQDMFTRWNYLRIHCKSEASKIKELEEWVNEVENIIQKVNLMHDWIKLPSSQKFQPLQFELLQGVMFWLLQHAFFLIEDIRILSTTTFDLSFKRLDSGLLFWQLGWMQTDKRVCEEISRIMFCNNNSI
jgi:hypothetical protein